MFRAAESALPGDRSIYRDDYARQFVADPKLRLLAAGPRIARATLAFLDIWTPGLAGQAFVRYRYFDELLTQLLAEGLEQVVVLGAGYDATCLRLGRRGSAATVFEVDEAEMQTRKRAVLAEIDPRIVGRTVFVECDFARDSVAERLRGAGHSRDERTLFGWLGVSWYLDARAVDELLAGLAVVAAPGSKIVFDYVHSAAISASSKPRGSRLAARVVAKHGEPWTFGVDPGEVDGWLAGLGWRVIENVPASEQRDRYQRLHSGRLRPAAEWVSVVQAIRADDGEQER